MKFSEINLNKLNYNEALSSYLSNNFIKPSNKEKKELQKVIEKSVLKAKYKVSINAITLGLCFDYDKTFENIRKKGVFRYSKYQKSKCIIKSLAEEIMYVCNSLSHAKQPDIDYLNSIILLEPTLQSYKELNKLVLAEIRDFKRNYKGKSLIKSLLCFNDYLFLINHYPDRNGDLDDIKGLRTKEEISSSVSYIIWLISELDGLTVSNSTLIADKYIESGAIKRIITACCFINELKEVEIFIDNFNYKCVKRDEVLEILPQSVCFEKSLRLGYIRTDIQIATDRLREDSGSESIKSIAEEIVNLFEVFVYIETHNYPRYILQMPEPLFDYLEKNILSPDHLFKEDFEYLSNVFKEQLLNFEKLKNEKIAANLTLLEFLKLIRVFTFFQILFEISVYDKNKDIKTGDVIRSLIPNFSEDHIYEILEKFTTTEKAESFLDLVTWEQGNQNLYDIQYYPFLFIDGYYLLSMNIMQRSNSLRNLIASEYKKGNKHILKDGKDDELINRLIRLSEKLNLDYDFGLNFSGGEIDFILVIEKTAFIFECKQTLHPASIYDLRTLNDYVNKAENQLDKIISLNEDEKLFQQFNSKRINFSKIESVVPAIILNSRLFNGNCSKYPIRNIHELVNILERGTAVTIKETYKLWESNNLQLSDVLDYFDKQNKIYKYFFNSSLQLYKHNIPITSPEIVYDTYFINLMEEPQKFDEYMKIHYSKLNPKQPHTTTPLT